MAKKSAYTVRISFFGRIKIAFTGGPTYPAQEEELREAGRLYKSMIGRHEVLTGREWIARIVDRVAPSSKRDKHIRAIEALMC